ncbi:MAG: hypothetical protein NTV51_30725, partial [Verrucomicrobia bacterium]|nr:hypothetical protein [Verrucomicrobiota bacterium]
MAGPAALPPKSEDRVTTEAAQRLDRLTEAYGLSAGQRAAILPILLRHASTARMSAAAATGALG